MSLADLEKRLLDAARRTPPSDAVPYAFEKRVMARVAGRRLDHWAEWTRGLWRAVAPCLGVLLLLGFVSARQTLPRVPERSLDSDLERVVFAAVEDVGDTW